LSESGGKAFSSLQTLEDRSIFLYSYLKNVSSKDFEKNQLLFKIAFFLADAILGSSLPYASYPDLLDPKKNPFVAYLTTAKLCPDTQTLYCIYLSVLHNIADPMNGNEWIYDEQIYEQGGMEAKLEELGRNFCEGAVTMPNPDVFEIDASLQLIQLKLIWLFGQQEARR